MHQQTRIHQQVSSPHVLPLRYSFCLPLPHALALQAFWSLCPPLAAGSFAFSYTLSTGVSLGPVLAPWVRSRYFLSLPFPSWNISFSSVGCGFCVSGRSLKPISNPFLSSWFDSCFQCCRQPPQTWPLHRNCSVSSHGVIPSLLLCISLRDITVHPAAQRNKQATNIRCLSGENSPNSVRAEPLQIINDITFLFARKIREFFKNIFEIIFILFLFPSNHSTYLPCSLSNLWLLFL